MEMIDMETYRRSLTTLLRNKNNSGTTDDAKHVAGAQRVLDFMNDSWQRQKLCDVLISANNGDLQAHRVALGAYSDALASVLGAYNSGDVIRLDLTDFQSEAVITILRFLYTTELHLDCNTVSQVLSCASELGITEVVRECMLYLLQNCNPGNAILHYSIAENNELPELSESVLEFILDRFSEIAGTEHFMYIPAERLRTILDDDRLCATNELEIFDAVVRWVNFDRVNRRQFASQLIDCVRLPLMSIDQLIQHVEPAADWLFSDADWKRLYLAMKVKALVASDRAVAENLRPRPRRCKRKRGDRVVGPDGRVYIRIRRTPRRSLNTPGTHGYRSGQQLVQDAADAGLTGVPSAQILQGQTAPSVSPMPSPSPSAALQPAAVASSVVPPVSAAADEPVVKQRAVRQVVNVDVALAGSPKTPVIVPPSFIHRSLDQRNHPDSLELVAVGGIDLENISGDMPGRLQCSYDSPNNAWKTMTTKLPEFVHHHGVTSVDGRLYVVGGAVHRADEPHKLGTATNAVRVFESATGGGQGGTWFPVASMRERRAYLSVAVWRTNIFAIGGEDENKTKLSSIEMFSAADNAWMHSTSMPSGPKLGVAAAVLGDALILVGGFNKDNAESPIMPDVDRFNILLKSWEKLTSLAVPRCHANLVNVQGRLYLVGGRMPGEDPNHTVSSDTIERYDHNEDQWQLFAKLRVGRHDAACAAVGTLIYIVGGIRNPTTACLRSVECVDVAAGEWFDGIRDYPYRATGIGCSSVLRVA